MEADGSVDGKPAGSSRLSLVLFLCLHVLIIFATLTIVTAAAGRVLIAVGNMLTVVASSSATPVATRIVVAGCLSLIALSDTLTLPDVVTAKTGIAKLSLRTIQKLSRHALSSVGLAHRLASPPLRQAARFRAAATRVMTRNSIIHLLATAPWTPFRAMRGATRGLSRMMSNEDVVSAGPDAPGAHADAELQRAIRAARLVQNFYTFQKIRARCLRRQALLRNGSMRFWSHVQHGGTRHRPARFIRVAADVRKQASPVRDQADAVARWLTQDSALGIPTVLISVTGGAQSLGLPQDVQQVFERGLVRAARTRGTWILTGGTASGVMKLVGDAIADYSVSTSSVTAIGFATWGNIAKRHELDARESPAEYLGDSDDDGDESAVVVDRPYTASGERDNSRAHAALEPNHSHFVLVDTGKEGKSAWGGEIDLRRQVEHLIMHRYGVPMVTVVVGGGPNTVKTVKEAITNDCPCLLLVGSGGAADAIAAYLDFRRAQSDAHDEASDTTSAPSHLGSHRASRAVTPAPSESMSAPSTVSPPAVALSSSCPPHLSGSDTRVGAHDDDAAADDGGAGDDCLPFLATLGPSWHASSLHRARGDTWQVMMPSTRTPWLPSTKRLQSMPWRAPSATSGRLGRRHARQVLRGGRCCAHSRATWSRAVQPMGASW